MISKNKIIRAVQEGIQSGFKFNSNQKVDSSDIIDFSDSKINNVESFNLKILEKDFVDLGLSVKWAKCNIGATCQDTLKSWYGGYYAWGEINTKQVHNKNNYDLNLYQKYNKDNFHCLYPEDDIVTQMYYDMDIFRMPTQEECQELLSVPSHEWVSNYQGIEGLNGMVFTGKNGNSIFIPASGRSTGSGLRGLGSYTYLWSSTPDFSSDSHAYSIYLDKLAAPSVGDDFRCVGFTIRGICSQK